MSAVLLDLFRGAAEQPLAEVAPEVGAWSPISAQLRCDGAGPGPWLNAGGIYPGDAGHDSATLETPLPATGSTVQLQLAMLTPPAAGSYVDLTALDPDGNGWQCTYDTGTPGWTISQIQGNIVTDSTAPGGAIAAGETVHAVLTIAPASLHLVASNGASGTQVLDPVQATPVHLVLTLHSDDGPDPTSGLHVQQLLVTIP